MIYALCRDMLMNWSLICALCRDMLMNWSLICVLCRYRAPECLLTDGYYTYKMDIWSIGCVFFEILRSGRVFGVCLYLIYCWPHPAYHHHC